MRYLNDENDEFVLFDLVYYSIWPDTYRTEAFEFAAELLSLERV